MSNPEDLLSESMAPALLAAYQATLAEMQSLRQREIGWVDQDVFEAVKKVVTHIPKIHSLRPQFNVFGPGFRAHWVDDLERYAHAALHAFIAYRDHPEPEGSLAELVKRAGELRSILATDSAALIAHKLLDERWLPDFDGGVGAQAIACDLLVLRGVLERAHPRVKGKSAFTLDELVRAESFARAILQRLSDPSEPEPLIWEAADLHQRSFTLLDRAYHEARRAVVFLRWGKEDDHEYAPVLHQYNRMLERWRVAGKEAGQPSEDARRRAGFAAAAFTWSTQRRPIQN
jgi:hypothetical protein